MILVYNKKQSTYRFDLILEFSKNKKFILIGSQYITPFVAIVNSLTVFREHCQFITIDLLSSSRVYNLTRF